MAKNNKAVLTAAITGAVHVPSMSPYLPITPEQIVEQSVQACKAGAAVVHLHGRDPETGAPSSDLHLMREVAAEIKRHCPVIVNISTGASQMMSTKERLSAVPDMEPELASCNAGSMNFMLAGVLKLLPKECPKWQSDYLGGTYDNVFSNTYQGMDTYIKTMQEHGTIPEFEVYEIGMINNIKYFRDKGILTCPIYIQFVLGIQGGMPASVENLAFMLNAAHQQLGEDGFRWSAAAAGKHQFPITVAALAMGGGARVGLEDNLYIRPHELATSNAQQVEAIASVAHVLGREVATPDEARELLGLKGCDKVNF